MVKAILQWKLNSLELGFTKCSNSEWTDIFIIWCYIHDYNFYVQMSSLFWYCAAFYADTNTSEEHAVSIIWFKI